MLHPRLPKLALSIIQPWPWLIISGFKSVENRSWRTGNPGRRFRGEFAIHAGQKLDQDCVEDILASRHPVTGVHFDFGPVPDFQRGGIIGVAEIIDVVSEHDSDYFVGPIALVVANARPVDFIPVKGALGFFDWRRNLEGHST